MIWYNSRFYDPVLGRWLKPDTVVPLASQGVQAWDRYAYVNNNSVKYDDPTGRDVGCGGRDASECAPPPPPKPPLPPEPPEPQIPLRPIQVNETEGIEDYYLDEKGNNFYPETGDYQYTVMVQGSERSFLSVYLAPEEGSPIPWTPSWSIDYKASYETKVFENGMTLLIHENYTVSRNTNDFEGTVISSVSIGINPTTTRVFALGLLEGKGERETGPFWIENGNIETKITTRIAVTSWEGVSIPFHSPLAINGPGPVHTYYFGR